MVQRRISRGAKHLLLLQPRGLGAPALTSAAPTISGTEVTFPATSSGSLVGYAYGVEFGIGISAGYTDASSVAGAAANQSIMVDIAGFAGGTTSVVNARTYYNADPLDLDPADRVYGSAVPVVVNSASETGTETEGQTLTGAHGIIVGPSGMTLSQAWQRCDSGGANCSAIAGETATTYVLAAADVGNTIKFQQTATNGADSDTATSAASGVIQAAVTATQYQLPTSAYLNAASATQYQTPYGYVNG